MMNYRFDVMETLVADLRRECDDKSVTHARARNLLMLVQDLVKQTRPGVGEFKWSAKAVKTLTKPAIHRKAKPSIIVARADHEVWHTDGHYLKLGEAPKRFGDVEAIDMPIAQIKRVIEMAVGGEAVTVTGAHDALGRDEVRLSNGAIVSRLLLAYVMDGYPDATLTCKGIEQAVCVYALGACVGLVMPVRQPVKK